MVSCARIRQEREAQLYIENLEKEALKEEALLESESFQDGFQASCQQADKDGSAPHHGQASSTRVAAGMKFTTSDPNTEADIVVYRNILENC